MSARSTRPRAAGVVVSISSRLAPTLPIWGNVKVMICPAYDGSVKISWYPVIAVLKQTSPTACPAAPMPRPQNTVPSANTRAALQSGGRGEGQAAVGSFIKAMSQRRDPGRPLSAAATAGRQATHHAEDTRCAVFVNPPAIEPLEFPNT